MNKLRLLKLARFLEVLPAKAFNMENWQSRAKKKREGSKPGQCGFVGCAVGWAAHQKMFPGLEFKPTRKGGRVMQIHYKGLESYQAAAAVFGLIYNPYESDDADYLFSPDGYENEPYFGQPTPYDVARRIRQYVKRGGSKPDHPHNN